LSAIRRSGRLRGRPAPTRGTLIASSTASSCMLSWRCPAVTTIESGRPLPSQARWILLVSPPRLRPSASSCGCTIPFLRQPGSVRDVRLLRAGALERLCCPRSPPTRPRLPRPTSSAHEPASGPRYRHAASARSDRSRSATGRSVTANLAKAPRSSASIRYRL
jgi:hypothetical protein